MGKQEAGSLSSFICYNCKEKNYFDRADYIGASDAEKASEMNNGALKVKQVSIECKSCREGNNITIEY
jgi:hypothetical protein